ncbi:TPA: hypothetical protein MYU15_002517, partial [Klebsiella pneumoniae]|nr:hypothetical protein [Klebsiella pneumoniae]
GTLEAEIEHVTQRLTNRIKELEERYNATLSDIIQNLAELEGKVLSHLKMMGLESV